MPLLFSQTPCWLSDFKAVEACQKQAEAVSEKPATSRLFNAYSKLSLRRTKFSYNILTTTSSKSANFSFNRSIVQRHFCVLGLQIVFWLPNIPVSRTA